MAATLVVDASVACKAIVDEDQSDAAHALFSGTDPLIAPAYLLLEGANALRKKVAAGQLERAGALAAYDDLVGAALELVPVTPTLAREALSIALAIGHPVQDCIYLALAQERHARVVTADPPFLPAVRRAPAAATLFAPATEPPPPRQP